MYRVEIVNQSAFPANRQMMIVQFFLVLDLKRKENEIKKRKKKCQVPPQCEPLIFFLLYHFE